jgi:two-component system, cell cycle sensor histidine kinase and response regulator CckA
MEIRSPSAIVNDVPAVPQQLEELHYLCCERSILLDLVTDAIILWSIDGTIKFWNRSAERMYGWRSAATIGKQIGNILYDREDLHYQTALADTLARGEWCGELQLSTKTGKNVTVASHWYQIITPTGSLQAILTIDSDITQHKILERQFLRTQRLENLGALASGIVHDLNNILTPIVAITELLPLRLKQIDERTQSLIKTLSENSKRGRDLIAQILTFAKGDGEEHTVLQPRHVLAEVLQIVRHTFPKSIDTSLQIASSDLWTLSADATQLYQVMMNLCINARDAMPAGGELTIMAENLILGDTYPKLHPDAGGGAYVAITIADTGAGIAPELVERIFEPFFTTKPLGAGTGLGLSTVLTIVNNHHGFVDITSQVGKGTQFRVYLPAIDRVEVAPVAATCSQLSGKGESILIVDDEPAIRDILGTTIESFNYQSITACNSQQAIEIYSQHHDRIQAILLDYMMPGGDSSETLARFQSIDPDVRTIVMSGLAAEEIAAKYQSETGEYFLAKPFTTQDLLQALKAVLN